MKNDTPVQQTFNVVRQLVGALATLTTMNSHMAATSSRRRSRFSIFTFLVTLVTLLSVVSASADPLPASDATRQSYADLGARRLMERASSESTTTKSSSTSTSTSQTVALASSTSTALPQPFDTTLGNNFTSDACPKFFVNFLSDATFQSCYPFSLLLQTSHGFFQAEKNFYQTTAVLQAGCTVDFDTCNNLMQSLAQQIKSQSNCYSDYQAENQLVMQAYNGFVAYPVSYQSSCLKDTKGDYCKPHLTAPLSIQVTNLALFRLRKRSYPPRQCVPRRRLLLLPAARHDHARRHPTLMQRLPQALNGHLPLVRVQLDATHQQHLRRRC